MACFVNRYGTNGSFRSGSGSSQATIHCKIIAAILLTTTLAACTGTSKPECVRAQSSRDCNSSNRGFSKPSPVVKGDLNKRHKKDSKPAAAPKPTLEAPKLEDPPMPPSNTPGPETPAPSPTVPTQETDVRQPNQSNSYDIKGFDPFGGLYGPGT